MKLCELKDQPYGDLIEIGQIEIITQSMVLLTKTYLI